MQAVINETLIKSLKPDTAKPYEVRDIKLQGFLVRVQPSGVMSYICQYRRGRRETLGRVGIMTLTRARQKAFDILRAEEAGGYQSAEVKLSTLTETLGGFMEHEYIPHYKMHSRPPYKNLDNHSSFKEYYGKKLKEIDAKLMERWFAQLRIKGLADTTIKRYFNSFNAVLTFAVKRGVLARHPCEGMKRIKVEDVGRTRFLSDQEEKRLLRALDEREERVRAATAKHASRYKKQLPDTQVHFADYLKPIVLIARNTGMRKGELLSLKWSDVNFPSAVVTVRGETAKSRKTRHIPLNKLALDTLTKWREQSESDYLFPVQNFIQRWKVLMKEAKLEDFNFHDLRHDFASRLVMSGADIKTVQELLGHADLTMTLRYSHLAPSHKAAAVERLTER